MKRARWICCVLLLFCVCVCFSGCTLIEAKKALDKSFTVPAADPIGGYQIATSDGTYTVVACEGYKYSGFVATDNIKKAERFITPTATLILSSNSPDESPLYCYEPYIDSGKTYENPVTKIFDTLGGRLFEYTEETEIDGRKYDIFEAYEMIKTPAIESVGYRVYAMTIEWTDGNIYTFEYKLYDNGEERFNSDTPDEISRGLRWEIDMERSVLVSTRIEKELPFTYEQIEFGQEDVEILSNSANDYHKRYVRAFVEQKSGELEKLVYEDQEETMTVTFIRSFDIESPDTSELTRIMSDAERESLIHFLDMIENIL